MVVFMVLREINIEGSHTLFVWLSKSEANEDYLKIIQQRLEEKYTNLVIFKSGNQPIEAVLKYMIELQRAKDK